MSENQTLFARLISSPSLVYKGVLYVMVSSAVKRLSSWKMHLLQNVVPLQNKIIRRYGQLIVYRATVAER